MYMYIYVCMCVCMYNMHLIRARFPHSDTICAGTFLVSDSLIPFVIV